MSQLVNMLTIMIALNQLVNMLTIMIALNQLVNMLTIMIALNQLVNDPESSQSRHLQPGLFATVGLKADVS
jgi:hypothetical protein